MIFEPVSMNMIFALDSPLHWVGVPASEPGQWASTDRPVAQPDMIRIKHGFGRPRIGSWIDDRKNNQFSPLESIHVRRIAKAKQLRG